MAAGAPGGHASAAARARARAHARARLHRQVGIASAAALLLGALPLLRALQAPRRDGAPAIAGLGSDLGAPLPGGVGVARLPGEGRERAEPRSGRDGGGRAKPAAADVSGETARTLRRMAEENANGPRLYALLEDAPTDRALAILLTAAGIRFRMESGVTGRITLRPVDGPRTAAQALEVVLPNNVGPRLGLTREGDTYVVRVETPDRAAAAAASAPPPGAAAPGAPSPAPRPAAGADAATPATDRGRDLPPAPRGQMILEPDGTIRRVAGIIIVARVPVVALLETIPPGGAPTFERVRPGERIEPGAAGGALYRAESLQVDGVILRGTEGQTLLVPLAARSSPIVRTSEAMLPREGRVPSAVLPSASAEMGFPRSGWEQDTGVRRDGRPVFGP